jgi:dethiobiotin synthetase
MDNRIGRSARHRGSYPRTSSGPLFRSTRSRQGFFVTGTDTGVGKTLVACALLRAHVARGMTAAGMKPVATGITPGTPGDVEQLLAAANVTAPREEVNPYGFAPPIAPHIAAQQAGVRIEIERIERAFRALARRAQVVVVEGIGGFCVPLGGRSDTAQLAARLGLPVVLVVGMRLGCLNHALLATEAIAKRGLVLAGWVANHIDPQMAAPTENVEALRQSMAAPLLARVAHAWNPDPVEIASRLNLAELINGRALNGRVRSVRTRAIKSARKRPI